MATTETPASTITPDGTPLPDPKPEGFWSSKRNVLSLVLVGVTLVVAGWLILDDPDPAAAPAAPGAASAPPGGGTGCGPAAGSQIPPAEAPETEWTLLGSMAAPTSELVGPAENVDGIPVCFSADPTGALFALATFVAATSDSDLRRNAFEALGADGPGLYQAIGQIDARGPGPDSLGVQIAGFDYVSYSEGKSAVIDLALRVDGKLAHAPIEVIWGGRDWLIEVPVTGDPYDAFMPLGDLSGFAQWQGA